MELFRDDNTDGYSKNRLNKLNKEWEKIVKEKNLNASTEKYDQAAQEFSDQVARR